MITTCFIFVGQLKWSQIQLRHTDKKSRQSPSPSHSSVLATPTREDALSATAGRAAEEGQLVDLDDRTTHEEGQDQPSHMQLASDVFVTPEEYESTWTMLSV